jgi:hypothetical protein
MGGVERCELTDLPADSCGCARHRASPGFGARHDQGPDAAVAAPPLAISTDLRLNPAFDGRIHRRDCWHLGGIDGVQKEADWTSYETVDAAFVRANRHLCCSTCDPGRDA